MKHLIYFLLIILGLFSCAEHEAIVDELTPPYFPVQSKTVGRVLDQNGSPIADASVELNGLTAATNSLGLFRFKEMELNGAGTHLTVRKLGYFNAFRTFIPNIPSVSSITVYMIDRPISGSFPHNTGGTIQVNGGGSVTLPPNAVVTASGAPYTGEVVVSAYWIDPTDVNALSVMPGDLRGYSLDGDRVQLATYGMMVVELETPSGQPLNLGNGQNATLTFPVGTLANSAPAVIPLWSYNEMEGHWEEEGTANIVGSNYVAEVGHFSWWNCDVPFPLVDYEVSVVSPAGDPIHGAPVTIKITSGNLTGRPLVGTNVTNQHGKAFGKIPSDEVLEMTVGPFTNSSGCEFLEFAEEIGPFSGPATTSITLDRASGLRIVNIIGNVVDCDGNPVTDGIILTSINDSAFPINDDGTVNISLVSCLDDVDIVAYDFEAEKQSTSENYSTLNPVNNILITDLSTCDNLDEFISIQYLSVDEIYPLPVHRREGLSCIDFFGNEIAWNVQPVSLLLKWNLGDNLGLSDGAICFSGVPQAEFFGAPVLVQIDTYDAEGYIEGSYSGDIDSEIPSLVSGTFRVKTQ